MSKTTSPNITWEQRELQEQLEATEEQRQEAQDLAESVRGQLEGRGTFDRRTRGRLERAEEELEHLRVQVICFALLLAFDSCFVLDGECCYCLSRTFFRLA